MTMPTRRSRKRVKKDLGLTHNRREPKTVRLKGEALTALRREVFELCGGSLLDLDSGKVTDVAARCEVCDKYIFWELWHGHPNSFHLAHKRNKRMHGDSVKNTRGLCRDCHLIGDHNPKPCPPKPR